MDCELEFALLYFTFFIYRSRISLILQRLYLVSSELSIDDIYMLVHFRYMSACNQFLLMKTQSLANKKANDVLIDEHPMLRHIWKLKEVSQFSSSLHFP